MEHKIYSRKTYFFVFLALLVLLVATIGAAFVDLGILNPIIALTIASTKALLVILYFMHVRESDQLTKVYVAVGFFWLAILIGLTLSDYLTRTGVLLAR